jgi:hypothetical protein
MQCILHTIGLQLILRAHGGIERGERLSAQAMIRDDARRVAWVHGHKD